MSACFCINKNIYIYTPHTLHNILFGVCYSLPSGATDFAPKSVRPSHGTTTIRCPAGRGDRNEPSLLRSLWPEGWPHGPRGQQELSASGQKGVTCQTGPDVVVDVYAGARDTLGRSGGGGAVYMKSIHLSALNSSTSKTSIRIVTWATRKGF